MKNCDPLVFFPALAMERRPGLSCFFWKFSSVKNELTNGYIFLRSQAPTCEFLAVDGLSTSSVSFGEISTLEHEFRDYTVERGAFITVTILTGAQFAEISRSLGHYVVV